MGVQNYIKRIKLCVTAEDNCPIVYYLIIIFDNYVEM